jgi:hypothetical protein
MFAAIKYCPITMSRLAIAGVDVRLRPIPDLPECLLFGAIRRKADIEQAKLDL